MNAIELLERHNPFLVILPNDVLLHRPWSRWYQRVNRQRGDYHPCAAEFFLSYVTQRQHRKAWNPISFTDTSLSQPTGLEALKVLVEAAPADAPRDWEIDIGPLKSQDPDQAWSAYGWMLKDGAAAGKPVVYGRYVDGPRSVLQYWYLYVYNDAPNKHEGDWEMVAVELDAAGTPVQAGYAGHAAGFRRPWREVELLHDRPVVYVARGSHAAYFSHNPHGHKTNSLTPHKGFPPPIEAAWIRLTRGFQDMAAFLRLHDRTAANPNSSRPGDRDFGMLLDPALIVLPEREDAASQPGFWWMRLDCNWGSSHVRFFGSVAPPPPWQQKQKWYTPAAWLDSLVPG